MCSAISVLLALYLLTWTGPAAAQTIPPLATTVKGIVSINGPVILPPRITSVPLRRAQVVLYRIAFGDDDLAIPFPVAFGSTDDNGAYSLSVETTIDPEFPDIDFAVGVFLNDTDPNLLSMRDQERNPHETAYMISRGFKVRGGTTATADLAMTIDKSTNDTAYTIQQLAFQPVQLSFGYNYEQGMSEVGGDHFAHLAVLYARAQTAALFAKDALGEPLPPINVRGWDAEAATMFYRDSEASIKVPPATSLIGNHESPEANIFNLRHEYAHHLMWASPVAGVNSDARDFDHIDEHAGLENHTSGDSWNEGFANYIPAAIAESLGEPEPHLVEMSGGVIDLLHGGARLDDPNRPDWQPAFGNLGEELAIASLLWEAQTIITRDELWATLRRNEPNLKTFKAVYDALKADPASFAAVKCAYEATGGTAAGVDCLFIDHGFYHDLDGDGLYDADEAVGVTRWPPTERPSDFFRPSVPIIQGSEMLLAVMDESGVALDGVQLSIRIEYEPPLESAGFAYDAALSGPQPFRVPIIVPANPARAVVKAVKDGYEPSIGLVIESEVYHDLVNPYRPGGVPDLLVEHTFVLTRSETPNTAPLAEANGPYIVAAGDAITLEGAGSDPDGDPLTFSWDLDGDGSFETPGPQATFATTRLDAPGSRTVVLQVCDNHGACATASTTVDVIAPPDPFAALYPARLIDVGLGVQELADLNNDGIVDLTGFGSAGLGTAALAASLGLADHTFAAPLLTPLPSGGFTTDYTLAKVNDDDFLDALLVDQFGSRLQVMLGDGRGAFAAGQAVSAGNLPGRVVAGDVNRDGNPDALLVNSTGRTISVLLGTGDGTFEAALSTATGSTPTDIAVASLDADDLPDIVVTLTNATVAVFPGRGDGTFGTMRAFATGSFPQRVAAADVNVDGHADVITTNGSGDSVSVLLGNGDGSLQAKADYPTGDNPRELVLRDLDGDGDADLVVAHRGADYHAILLNDGRGLFAVQTPAFTSNDGSCLVGDFDGDGRLDILSPAFSGSGSQAFISLGLPGARFDTRSQVIMPGVFPADYALGDVDGDGVTDVAIANGNTGANSIEVLVGRADGSFVPSHSIAIGKKIVGLALAPFDAGSTLDLAVITERPAEFPPAGSSNQLLLLLGDGSGNFLAQPPVALPDRPGDLLVGDLNGDGQNDLLVMLFFADQAAPFLNQGDGGFVAGPLLAIGGRPFHTELHDVNADGRSDFVVTAFIEAATRLRVYHAGDDGVLAQVQEIPSPATGSWSDIRLHDFSGDGRSDLAALLATSPKRVVYYAANADGTFGPEQTVLEDVLAYATFSVADINADGNADLVVGDAIYLADSAGFAGPQEYWIRSTLPVSVGDFNGDELPDLVTADTSSNALRVLLHK
jgi:hypothetical protein